MQKFTGTQYLKIDIASNYGLDKENWEERLRWFDTNESQLEKMVNTAENPALYYAGVKAYRDTQQGIPTGYMISLDATSSGLQILAVLACDRLAGSLCNVIPTGRREDAYKNIYKEMLKEAEGNSSITREMTKRAIMTALYGSKAVPEEVFGDGDLLATFYRTMERMTPGAWELNSVFMQLWNSRGLSHDWILPDNFDVRNKVLAPVTEVVYIDTEPFEIFYKENKPMDEGRSIGANITHSIDGMMVREIVRRCNYDPEMIKKLRKALVQGNGTRQHKHNDKQVITLWNHYLETGYLSARILQHLREENIGLVDKGVIEALLNSLPAKPFDVVAVHDCFRCHPNYGNDLRQQYNNQLYEIAKSDILSSIVTQLIGVRVQANKLNPSMAYDILNADYALS